MALQLFRDDLFSPFSWERDLGMTPYSRNDREMTQMTRSLRPIMQIDFVETENDYHLQADLPGVKEEDLDIQVIEDNLIIKGHREKSFNEETSTSHRIERSYGSVQRTLRLPANADKSHIQAHFENGVLTVSLPKCEPSPRSMKVPIQSTKSEKKHHKH